jgi:hypothetical protein
LPVRVPTVAVSPAVVVVVSVVVVVDVVGEGPEVREALNEPLAVPPWSAQPLTLPEALPEGEMETDTTQPKAAPALPLPLELIDPLNVIVPYCGTGPNEPLKELPATLKLIGAEPVTVPVPGTFAE